MVSTRRAPPEQRAQLDDAQEKQGQTASKTATELSPSRKRRADIDHQQSDERAEKRRQLTPSGEKEEVVKATDAGPNVARNPRQNGADGKQDARQRLEMAAQELLKLYACTRSFEYLSAILSRPSSRKGRLYRLQYEQFQRHRSNFPTTDNFISPTSFDAGVESQRFARCINFVTFAASMLGSRDASFSQLNHHFFEVFIDRTGVRTGHLVKLQADILLGLKTQAYIAQAAEKGSLQESLLNDLFPSDMTQRLLNLQSEAGNAKLVASEQTFVKQIIMRKRHLSKKESPESIASLKDEYKWNDVLKNMLEYLKQHFEEIAQKPSNQIRSMNDDEEKEEDVRAEVPVKTEKPPARLSAPVRPPQASNTTSMQSTPLPHKPKIEPDNPNQGQSVAITTGGPSQESTGLDTSDDILMKAMQAANQAMEGTIADISHVPPQLSANTAYPNQSGQEQQQHLLGTQPTSQLVPNYSSSSPHMLTAQVGNSVSPKASQPSAFSAAGQQSPQSQTRAALAPNGQSHPTHQLYEMAREATTGRPSQQQPPRRSGSQSQRRPWTQEEEKALLDGLDQVKGPHWSMILQLYGPGGKISEVLKDRNQVQLKDKARNLKLWFLKSGGEVPVNLRSVTGELKTRAPAAIRNAAAAAAAAQAQTNGVPNSPAVSGQSATNQHHQGSFDPNNTPYAPAGPYAATAPANSAPSMNAPMPTAGPQDTSSIPQNPGLPLADASGAFDSWNDAADAAAAQVIKDLQVDLGLSADLLADLADNSAPSQSIGQEAVQSAGPIDAIQNHETKDDVILANNAVAQDSIADPLAELGSTEDADDIGAAAAAAAAAAAVNGSGPDPATMSLADAEADGDDDLEKAAIAAAEASIKPEEVPSV